MFINSCVCWTKCQTPRMKSIHFMISWIFMNTYLWVTTFSIIFNSEKSLNLLSFKYSSDLCFQLHSCLFVWLIISDFLLSLLVFVWSPPPYFIRSIFPASPPAQSGKAKHRCRRFALYPRILAPIGGTGRAQPVLPPHWSNPILSALWLVGADSGGWSVGGLGGVLRARPSCLSSQAAYLCLHSHRQPAQVLTLGGDY